MTDRIVLSGVSGTGFHGVFDHEKRDGQTFVVDVAIDADLAAAGRSDDLSRTVNYGEIGAVVLERIEGEPFDLIERLASVIAQDVLAGHRLVDEVTVTVHKPQAPVGVPFADVTVSVARRRDPVPVVIALGANLGDAQGALMSAVASIMDLAGVTAVQVSDVVETDPWEVRTSRSTSTKWSRRRPGGARRGCLPPCTESRPSTAECGRSVGARGLWTST